MLFIVAVTLGLLAVMGVYGLTAASADVRAAGNMREALQGQRAGEAAIVMTAETFNPATASTLITQMSQNKGQATNCLSAATYDNTYTNKDRVAQSCLMLDPTQMQLIASQTTATVNANPWASSTPYQPGFTGQSFGLVTNQPFISVEVTNPIDIATTTGNSQAVHYTQLTATVYVQMKPTAAVAAQTLVKARGRITVGPILSNGGLVAAF